jgi:hypothetical protein
MDYVDVYFTFNAISLAVLCAAIAVTCYLTHRQQHH